MTRRTIIVSIIIFLIPGVVSAGLLDRVKLPEVKVPQIKIPGLEGLIGDDPVVSTSLADAMTEISFLDGYTPKQPIPLDCLRPNSDGVFKLIPGAYEFDAQSYCLHAGTYGPSKGDGYLYAPLKGSKSGIINSILKQSMKHPEIPQENVQTLIWAVLARTKINEMSSEDRNTASKLLTKSEIKDLEGGALGVIPEDKLSGLIGELTEPVRRVLEAENSLRQKLTDSTATYDELEEIAVLTGKHPRGKGSRDIPAGRWSYHPDGYFVRYLPTGYVETHMDIYVPENFIIKRDEKGRIISLTNGKGSSIELAYDDTIHSPVISDDKQISAYALKLVKFIEKLPGDNTIERNWEDTGWTLIGIPSGKGRALSGSGRFVGLDIRYKSAASLVKEFDETTARVAKSVRPKTTVSQSGLADMLDMSHLRTALAEVVGKDAVNDLWTADHLDMITNAWQSAFHQRVNNIQVAALPEALVGLIGAASDGSDGSGGAGGGAGFSPGGGVAAPGDTSQQRLAPSGRPRRECGDSGGDGAGDALKRALSNNGFDVKDENLDIRDSGPGGCRIIRFHVPLGEGGNPLPKLGCTPANAPPGSLEGPKEILFGSIQQCGDETMVNVRKTDLETGEVTDAGRGRSKGTDDSAAESAASDALGDMGL